MNAQPLKTIFSQPGGRLSQLQQHIAEVQKLDPILKQHLPETLRPHCQVINLRDNTLVIGVSSSVWANALRYRVPGLLQALQEAGLHAISRLDISIQPSSL